MKLKLALTALVAATALSSSAADFREHRGVYISPYVADWPSSAITARNAQQHKNILTKNLDKLQANGVNIVYFAVRPLCDAAYKSKYEPWSSTVSGTRGVEPPFDPLQFLIDEAHARGIEVYTWLNAYRYCTKYKHGESPLDYELTHPEWLLVQDHETILNPALEEVKQRVCDVAADIVDNYDIDGFLFDDYYYSNPTPMEVDAEYYEAAKAADPTIGDQLQWRIDNVSSMIDRVSKVVKGHKPWVVFGIKPAGVASPPNIRDYGLEPSPSNIREQDWQYKAVAADPIYWYSQHYCDFMAPQIYWCDLFNPLQDWWVKASRKFDRHLYSAVSVANFNDFGCAEFAREAEYARQGQADNISGIGFFRWYYYINSASKIDGVSRDLPSYMGETAFNTPALCPVRHWNNEYTPVNVTGLHRDGDQLLWDNIDNMRYTIYAFREGEEQKPFNTNLVQVRYTNSFTIPDDLAGCTFGVAAYDRYANEYPMTTEGASLGEAVVPKLTYPQDGAVAADLFDFQWEDTGCDCILEISDDPSFSTYRVKLPTTKTSVNSYVVNNLAEGETCYWRVRTNGVNAPAGVSETRSFTASRIAVTGPTSSEESATPTITWTPAFDGAEYTVELGRNSQFTIIDYTGTTTEPSLTVPEDEILTGHVYYVRVTATRDGNTSRSDVKSFSTADVEYAAPLFVNPAVEGCEIHANESVEITHIKNVTSRTIEICATDAFPLRSTYKLTLRDATCTTPELGTIKISSRPLENGKTYYVRTATNYFVQASSSSEQRSEYRVSTFVYNDQAGIGSVEVESAVPAISAEGILSLPAVGNKVSVYTPDGRSVYTVGAAGLSVDLSSIAPGLYLIRVDGPTPATLKWNK